MLPNYLILTELHYITVMELRYDMLTELHYINGITFNRIILHYQSSLC